MELQSGRVAVIDADSICFIAHWDSDSKSFDKPLEDIYRSVDQIISSIFINTKCDEYIGFVGFGSCSERMMIYPEYKANRKGKELPKYLKDIKNYMVDKWKFIALHGIEADDMVNSVRVKIDNSVICAIDKDLLMLEGTHYNYKKNEWVTVNQQEADYYFWMSMITGDTADNIKGIEGKGKAYATKLFGACKVSTLLMQTVLIEYIDTYGEIDGITKFYQNYACLKIKDNFPATGFLNPFRVDVNNLVI